MLLAKHEANMQQRVEKRSNTNYEYIQNTKPSNETTNQDISQRVGQSTILDASSEHN